MKKTEKSRKLKVFARNKKANSLSHSSFFIIEKLKRRNATLVKNNRNLARALQDARYKLANKRSVLKDCAENMKRMMFSRFKMMDLASKFKSFMKESEEIVDLLSVDNTKWPNLGISPLEFKRKIKSPCFSTVEEAVEPESLRFEDENEIEDVCKNVLDVVTRNIAERPNSDDFPLDTGCSQESIDEINGKMEACNQIKENKTDHCLKTLLSCIDEDHAEILPMEYSPAPYGTGMDSGVPQDGSPALGIFVSAPESAIEKESQTTPRPPTLNKSLNAVLVHTKKDKKDRISKIPRLQDVYTKNTNSNNVIIKNTKISVDENHTTSLEKLNKEHRNTFVAPPKVLDNTSDVSDIPENCITSLDFDAKGSNSEDVEIETNGVSAGNNKNDNLKCRRKTFVVKQGKNRKSLDRRKTFVKAVHDVNKVVSIKDKRKTFTVPINKVVVDEKIVSCENPDTVTGTLLSENISEAETVLYNVNDILTTEVLPVPINTSSLSSNENSKKCEQSLRITEPRNDTNANILPSKIAFMDLKEDCQSVSKQCESVLNSEEIDTSEIVNEIKYLKSNVDTFGESVYVSDLNSRSMNFNLKRSCENNLSPSSSIWKISDIDISEFSSIKNMPIRKQIGKSKKVFIFNTNDDKRKSILKPSSVNFKPSEINSQIPDESLFQSNASNSANINKEHIQDASACLFSVVENKRKSVRFEASNTNTVMKTIPGIKCDKNSEVLNGNIRQRDITCTVDDKCASNYSDLKTNKSTDVGNINSVMACEGMTKNKSSSEVLLSTEQGKNMSIKKIKQKLNQDKSAVVENKRKSVQFGVINTNAIAKIVADAKCDRNAEYFNVENIHQKEKKSAQLGVTNTIEKILLDAECDRNSDNLNVENFEQIGIPCIEDMCASNSNLKTDKITDIRNANSVMTHEGMMTMNKLSIVEVLISSKQEKNERKLSSDVLLSNEQEKNGSIKKTIQKQNQDKSEIVENQRNKRKKKRKSAISDISNANIVTKTIPSAKCNRNSENFDENIQQKEIPCTDEDMCTSNYSDLKTNKIASKRNKSSVMTCEGMMTMDMLSSEQKRKSKNKLSIIGVLTPNEQEKSESKLSNKTLLTNDQKKKDKNIKKTKQNLNQDKSEQIETNSLDVESEPKSKKSHKTKTNAKRSSPVDDIILDENIPASKKAKKKQTNKQMNRIPKKGTFWDQNACTDDLLLESSKMRSKEKETLKPFEKIVQAEIHPPPPFLPPSPNKIISENKENMELSIVLSDILRSKDINQLNIFYDKELILPKDLISQSSTNSNITPTDEGTNSITKKTPAQSNFQDVRSRRVRKPVVYTEPSLHVKLRR